jgi:hypothetical protein
LNGNLTILGKLAVQQFSNVNIINTTTTNYSLIVGEDLSMNGRLFVSSDVSINGNLGVAGDVSMNSRLFLNTGSLYVNGVAFTGASSNFTTDVSMNARLLVVGDVSLNGNVSINNTLTLNDGTYFKPAYTVADFTKFGTTFTPNFYVNFKSWSAIGISSTGQYQTIAASSSNGSMYRSSSYGAANTWTAGADTSGWVSIAISSTGQYQIACSTGYNLLYISSNYSVSWTQVTSAAVNVSLALPFQAVSISSSGQYQTVVTNNTNGAVYISNDYGGSWTKVTSAPLNVGVNFTGLSISGDGQYQTATANNVGIYTSTNFGVTWTLKYSAARNWQGVSISSTGQYQSAVAYNSYIYRSEDFGTSWSQGNLLGNWLNVSVSSTGQYQVAGTNGFLYKSNNYGINGSWTTTESSRYWGGLAISGNGQVITAGDGNSYNIYVSICTVFYNSGAYFTADISMNGKLNVIADVSLNSRLFIGGNTSITGTLSKGGGSFDIVHPDPSKPPGTRLRHCFVEAPTRGDNIYRFKVTTSNLSAVQVLPSYYKFLNENTQIWVNPINCLGAGYGILNDDDQSINITVSVDGDYNVLVIGTRKDQLMIDYFDNNGGAEYTA